MFTLCRHWQLFDYVLAPLSAVCLNYSSLYSCLFTFISPLSAICLQYCSIFSCLFTFLHHCQLFVYIMQALTAVCLHLLHHCQLLVYIILAFTAVCLHLLHHCLLFVYILAPLSAIFVRCHNLVIEHEHYSLRSQSCKMRHFCWLSTTVRLVIMCLFLGLLLDDLFCKWWCEQNQMRSVLESASLSIACSSKQSAIMRWKEIFCQNDFLANSQRSIEKWKNVLFFSRIDKLLPSKGNIMTRNPNNIVTNWIISWWTLKRDKRRRKETKIGYCLSEIWPYFTVVCIP